VTFRQVALRHAGDAAAVRAALEAGTAPASLGRPGLLPAMMEGAGNAAVDGAFGPGFYERITQFAPGGWQGPVASAYGSHLVQVVAFEPGAVLPFETVRKLVTRDWQRAKAEEMREAQYSALQARHEIVLPDDAK